MSTMPTKNYVSVSGTSTEEEALSVVRLMHDTDFSRNPRTLTEHRRVGMLGFQVTQKSLQQGFSEGNNRVPPIRTLCDIINTVGLDIDIAIHYFTRNQENLVPEVRQIFGVLNDTYPVDCLQLNGVWPTPEQISEIKVIFHPISIIVQVTPKMVKDLTPAQVARKIKDDGLDNVEYLMLDPSLGRGIEFDVPQSVATFNAIRQADIKSGIVFAGGFNAENTKARVLTLKRELGNQPFSIDAEGGLRDKAPEGKNKDEDTLNLEKVEGYLRGADEAFKARIFI